MNMVGNSRGGAKGCAEHFMNTRDNEHIELFELRGFMSDTLEGALNEVYAISRGTKCQKFLYSLSLNPPPDAQVSTAAFEDAIERVEKELGLTDQPRAIVFHEKKGRRHAHCVWSRIDAAEMKAVNMSFDREKLQTISRELFLHHGWKMPPGLANREHSDPRNYTLAEWQQSRRSDRHPQAIKRDFEDAWAISDSRAAFVHALEERGYRIAKGNRRSFVAVDAHGEVYAIARQAGVKTKEVRARLGDGDDLPEVETIQAQFAAEMTETTARLKGELIAKHDHNELEFEDRRIELVRKQRSERERLEHTHKSRQKAETLERQARFRKGFAGIWDRLNGSHGKLKRQNETEAKASAKRDREENDALIFRHLGERKRLSLFRVSLRRDYGRQRARLERESQHHLGITTKPTGPEPNR